MSFCENVKECACPKETCSNNRRCCACIIKHRETDSIPYCLFPDNGGDKSNRNYYLTLKKRFEEKGDKPMKTLTIFEPAMCCPTGLCGVGINPDLMRLATVTENLKKNGVKVNRYNLSSAPAQFIQNAEINKLINEKGADILPVFMFDDKIEITGRYPSNAEIILHLDVPPDFLEAPRSGGCGCGAGSGGTDKKSCC